MSIEITDEGQQMEPQGEATTAMVGSPANPARKPKAPTYDVQRGVDATDGSQVDTWRDVGLSVRASSARDAIREATKDLPVDEQFGHFRVVLSAQVRELTRNKRVIPETVADEWA
jgi:hypothetical protein